MKINQYLFSSIFISALSLSQASCAAEKESKPDVKQLQEHWQMVLSGAEISQVKPAPISGLWEVQAGPHIFYTNSNGDKLIIGDIVSLENNKPVSLTEQQREQARLQAIKALNPDDFITFAAKNPQHSIYVLTDADCGYCRKFHEQRQEINDAGITIHYLAMPRTPEGTPSYNKAVAIWCAKDRQQALTEAKEDKFADIEKTCTTGEKIVATDVALARDLGAQGTPTIILDNGKLIPGYIPAKDLAAYFAELDKNKK